MLCVTSARLVRSLQNESDASGGRLVTKGCRSFPEVDTFVAGRSRSPRLTPVGQRASARPAARGSDSVCGIGVAGRGKAPGTPRVRVFGCQSVAGRRRGRARRADLRSPVGRPARGRTIRGSPITQAFSGQRVVFVAKQVLTFRQHRLAAAAGGFVCVKVAAGAAAGTSMGFGGVGGGSEMPRSTGRYVSRVSPGIRTRSRSAAPGTVRAATACSAGRGRRQVHRVRGRVGRRG
jgi:hypothetical protein